MKKNENENFKTDHNKESSITLSRISAKNSGTLRYVKAPQLSNVEIPKYNTLKPAPKLADVKRESMRHLVEPLKTTFINNDDDVISPKEGIEVEVTPKIDHGEQQPEGDVNYEANVTRTDLFEEIDMLFQGVSS